MRIIYFDHWSSASEYYRLMPLDYIKHPDISITRSTERSVTSHLLNNYDMVILLRPSSESHLAIIKLAKDLNKIVIADFDDDVLHVPADNPMFYTYQQEKASSIKCLSFVDEIWAATEGIKNAFKIYNKNIYIVSNAHNEVIFPLENKKTFTYNKTVLYRGGGSHEADIYEDGTAEWIVNLINANQDFSFHFWGQRFMFIEKRVKGTNHYTYDGASTIQFYKEMHKLNACIFQYPLANTLFNRSKSACSWLEATYSGSAYFGNVKLPEFNIIGVLPLSQLSYLMNQEEVLRLANEESWQNILDNFTLKQTNAKRLERLETYIK